MAAQSEPGTIYHNPKCSTSVRRRESLYTERALADASDDLLDAMAAHPILIVRPFVVTAKGTRLARPVDAIRDIL